LLILSVSEVAALSFTATDAQLPLLSETVADTSTIRCAKKKMGR